MLRDEHFFHKRAQRPQNMNISYCIYNSKEFSLRRKS